MFSFLFFLRNNEIGGLDMFASSSELKDTTSDSSSSETNSISSSSSSVDSSPSFSTVFYHVFLDFITFRFFSFPCLIGIFTCLILFWSIIYYLPPFYHLFLICFFYPFLPLIRSLFCFYFHLILTLASPLDLSHLEF